MGKHGLMTYQEYLASDVWRCEKSPTGAHHWIGVYPETSGIFYCKWCQEPRQFPGSWGKAKDMIEKGKTVPLSLSKSVLLPWEHPWTSRR